jgi:hypothetical protein
LGTSTVFEKQMAALEQEQAELDEATPPVVPLTNPKPKPKPKPRVKPPAAAAAATATAAAAAVLEPEKKKPGRKPKIQLVVKEP